MDLSTALKSPGVMSWKPHSQGSSDIPKVNKQNDDREHSRGKKDTPAYLCIPKGGAFQRFRRRIGLSINKVQDPAAQDRVLLQQNHAQICCTFGRVADAGRVHHQPERAALQWNVSE